KDKACNQFVQIVDENVRVVSRKGIRLIRVVRGAMKASDVGDYESVFRQRDHVLAIKTRFNIQPTRATEKGFHCVIGTAVSEGHTILVGSEEIDPLGRRVGLAQRFFLLAGFDKYPQIAYPAAPPSD